jgi:hypothetical protein
MIPRTVAVPTLLAASVAVPYVATNAPQWQQEWNAPPSASVMAPGVPGVPGPRPPALDPAAMQRHAALSSSPAGPGAVLYPTAAPLEGLPGYPLAEVLRLDVTKEWVYQRWPRKSTSLAELDLYGVRVPLVTGTQLHDLAGSLTYYFTPDGRVQLISFRGRTGDTTQLVAIATQRFGLTRQPTVAAGEQLFQLRESEKVLSSLRTRPAPVLWSSTPHESFAVEMDLQNPASARPLAQPGAEIAAAANAPPPLSEAAAEEAAAAEAGDKPKEPGWKAFFPRRRVPADQIPNLDHGNIYQ